MLNIVDSRLSTIFGMPKMVIDGTYLLMKSGEIHREITGI